MKKQIKNQIQRENELVIYARIKGQTHGLTFPFDETTDIETIITAFTDMFLQISEKIEQECDSS